jgi:hypothetical protein
VLRGGELRSCLRGEFWCIGRHRHDPQFLWVKPDAVAQAATGQVGRAAAIVRSGIERAMKRRRKRQEVCP